jgi:nitrite reductase/ring-hydroxylating ferredoxin subunit
MENLSRRHVLAAAAATVTLPMLQTAVGRMKSVIAAGGATASAPAAEKPGWFTTTLKAADLKDNEFVLVEGHKIIVTRSGKTVMALTSLCSHKQGNLKAKTGDAKIAWCPLHQSEFKLDGTVAKGPATAPLAPYAIRVDAKGMVEIDPGQKPEKTAKEYSVTLA